MSGYCKTCNVFAYATRGLATASKVRPPRPSYLNTKFKRGPLPQLGRKAPEHESLPNLLQKLTTLKADGLRPRPEAYVAIIRAAGDFALSRSVEGEESDNLGWQIALSAWNDAQQGKVDLGIEGMEVLLRLSGVETAWARVKSSYVPDEGLILSMLNAAGRWGRPDFASTILESLRIPPQEQHLAPLLEAFCNAGQVPDAFRVLSSIRDAGLTPTMATVQPLVSVLTNAEVIDQAFYALEDMHKAGESVDITALNALIDASARLGDLQRARATQTAATDLGLTPNIDTFNLVLSCCAVTKHRALGDTILNELVSLSISPSATTYEHMINLCLTQSKYEDAFYYLEKSKSDNFKPSYALYNSLVRKCISLNDSRWRLVVEELKTVGYRVDNELHEFINSGGKPRTREDRGGRRRDDKLRGSSRSSKE
ncbi:uncharacterized protein IL334_004988 [Kwoniella shivajii]|uniref:Pentatricopeptide repeat-containing protein-mitochondrial domain-containing protein n=1 Tax=Kwoniella shivajii TaxID=564305 RepID=A0ABZ1D224_9TREE|nr:hypothetical protein IL334_004988 [Kwoniella shivajii]